MKHEPVGITTGQIANMIDAPHNTLSAISPSWCGAGLLRSSHDHLPVRPRGHAIGDRVPGRRLLRRASGALQPGRRRRGLLRAARKARAVKKAAKRKV
jgi:hypothetical protein